VFPDDKVIRRDNASPSTLAAVVEEEALEVAIPHLSSEGVQERKKDAFAMQQPHPTGSQSSIAFPSGSWIRAIRPCAATY